MEEINYIRKNFNNFQMLQENFKNGNPVPYIILDNFLPKEYALSLEKECVTIPTEHWKKFTRRNSYMEECLNLEVAPVAFSIINQIHSQLGMEWLTNVTGIEGLIPDPYLIGAGYNKSYRGDTLKTHVDFNWNEKLKLHRALSLIIYLSSDWKEEYQGALEFKDFNNDHVVTRVTTFFNRCLIWKYNKRGYHGFNTPIDCPENMSRNSLRLFFYISNSTHNQEDLPHRSLYWFDPTTKEPYDIKFQ